MNPLRRMTLTKAAKQQQSAGGDNTTNRKRSKSRAPKRNQVGQDRPKLSKDAALSAIGESAEWARDESVLTELGAPSLDMDASAANKIQAQLQKNAQLRALTRQTSTYGTSPGQTFTCDCFPMSVPLHTSAKQSLRFVGRASSSKNRGVVGTCKCAKAALEKYKANKRLSKRTLDIIKKPGISKEILTEWRVKQEYNEEYAGLALKIDWVKIGAAKLSLPELTKAIMDANTKAITYKAIAGPTAGDMQTLVDVLEERFMSERNRPEELKKIIALSFTKRQFQSDYLSAEANDDDFNRSELLVQVITKSHYLRYLDLRESLLGVDGLISLAKCINFTTITDLCLSGCRAGDEVLNEANGFGAMLRKNVTLESLDMSCNGVTADGARSLALSLRYNKTLKVLNLNQNDLCDDGAVQFARVLDQCSLEALMIAANKITDDGGVELGKAIRSNKSLQILNLKQNRLTDTTGAVFLQISLLQGSSDGSNRVLSDLNLDINSVSDETLASIKEVLNRKDRLVLGFDTENRMRWKKDAEVLCKTNEGAKIIAEAIRQLSRSTDSKGLNEVEAFRALLVQEAKKATHKQCIMEKLILESSTIEEGAVGQINNRGTGNNNINNLGLSAISTVYQAQNHTTNLNISGMGNGMLDGSFMSRPPTLAAMLSAPIASRTRLRRNILSTELYSGYLECFKLMVDIGNFDLQARDTNLRRFAVVLESHPSDQVRGWAKSLDAFGGRFKLDPNSHFQYNESEKCIVKYGVDLTDNSAIAVKLMSSEAYQQREVTARTMVASSHRPISDYIVPIIQYGIETERKCSQPGKPYFITMPRAERSLFEVINGERIAGNASNLAGIKRIARQAAQALSVINIAGIIHGDFKPRNFMRLEQTPTDTEIPANIEGQQALAYAQWRLIDFDSFVRHGERLTEKYSSAYFSPEIARSKFLKEKTADLVADESMDVWSFGVVLYELLTGTPLFVATRDSDDLFSAREKIELLNWLDIDQLRLDRISDTLLANDEIIMATIEAAKDLVRKCLTRDPLARISFAQILCHDFMNEAAATSNGSLRLMRTLQASTSMTHFFLSHNQAQGSGVVKDIYYMSREHGCSSWLDVKAKDLTLNGMHNGIRQSKAFMLLLTKDALKSPFVLMEIMWAIDLGKPFICITVTEEEFKYADDISEEVFAFDREELVALYNDAEFIAKLCQQIGDSIKLDFQGIFKGMFDIPKLLNTHVKKHILKYTERKFTIPYRRRDYETKAMMNHIMNSLGLVTFEQLDGFVDKTPEIHDIVSTSTHIEAFILKGDLGLEDASFAAYEEFLEKLHMCYPKVSFVEVGSDTLLKDVQPRVKIQEKVFRFYLIFMTPGFFHTSHAQNITLLEGQFQVGQMPLVAIDCGWFSRTKTERLKELGTGNSYDSIMLYSEVMPFRSQKRSQYESDAMLGEIKKRVVSLAQAFVLLSTAK